MYTTLRYYLAVLLCCGYLIPSLVHAQTGCGDVVLRTQAEVDAFDPTCTLVESLTIDIEQGDDPITNLNALSSLTRVGNALSIIGGETTTLRNLTGLDNLRSISGDFTFSVPLKNFAGMEALETIGGKFIFPNYRVGDLTGLSGVRSIGGEINIIEANSSVSFQGLSAVESVGGFSFGRVGYISFTGLSSLEVIDGTLTSKNVNFLGTQGLENVREITGSLFVLIEDSFTGWAGLKNLRRIGGNFTVLSEAEGDYSFDELGNLREIGGRFRLNYFGRGRHLLEGFRDLRSVGSILIESGPLDGLEVIDTVKNDLIISAPGVTNISPLQGIQSIGGDLRLTGNSSLSSCCLITLLADRISGTIILKDNAPECNDLAAVEAECSNTTGVRYRYYEGEWDKLPDFSILEIAKTGALPNFSLSPAEQDDNYGFTYRTYLEVATAGEYTFFTNSDDGSRLLVDGQVVVDNNGQHDARERSGEITLNQGRHLLEVAYL